MISAGIATVENGHLERRARRRQARNLEQRLGREPLSGLAGIGHTRWATHGKPTENNAHPHATERLAVVHNGIIENFRELRDELAKEGAQFRIGNRHRSGGASRHRRDEKRHARRSRRCRRRLPRLRGAFALAFIFAGEDDLMIGARKGSPLAIGHGSDEMYLGSDAIALAPFTDTISYLEEGDWAVVQPRRRADLRRRRKAGRAREDQDHGLGLPGRQGQSPPFHGEGDPRAAGSGRPYAVALSRHGERMRGAARASCRSTSRQSSACAISACGTAYYAGLVAKYWFERYARLPVEIDVASEFRYREAPLAQGRP